MDGIGLLIKALRQEKEISISDLCTNICTERFMYMIENDNKVPSCTIVNKFNKKLGLNILDYLDYIGFERPIKSKFYIKTSRNLRYKYDYEGIEKVLDDIKKFDDVNNPPLFYEILSNKIFIEIFKNSNISEARKMIEFGIIHISGKTVNWNLENNNYLGNYYYINLLNYLFIYHKRNSDEKNAKILLEFLKSCTVLMDLNLDNNMIYISVIINYYYSKIFIEKSTEYLEDIEDLLRFQLENNNLDRLFLTYYLFSGHHYNLKEYSLSKFYFEKFVAAGKSLGIEKQFNQIIESLDKNFKETVCPEGKIIFEI